ncbi:UPF0309 protein [Caldalkalibacillus thermarum TA2.A1]|uniref:UPF0309 protein CathTA2_0529 n=1 Tax=Caldalkalibacillus thermarum (strain TA2.A1) TaxID=986075 RepID=F5L417_CALTT|nr:SIS domain-containing protein [Caldalkalibacillus thermarum]EGL83917.1 UPF0309 protein [Caldalkalibacillus thermarum TA2.A1]QZT34223.1 SIS domain-containing protein [Caldalkalibacillus thermarum TA2.A1]
MMQQYIQQIKALIAELEQGQKGNMRKAAEKVAESLAKGGIIQLFGAGHSHLLAEEVFYRAGGLVPVKPIFEESLMLHQGAVRSSQLEKQCGYADTFMPDQDIREHDVVFVISTSGRNPVPIDVALAAKAKGAYVIGITSLTYSRSQPSRHPSGQLLYEVVDLVIDNLSVKGDAILKHEKLSAPFGPSSTVIGAIILNSVFAEAIHLLLEQGTEPPVFLSGNLDGAEAHNQALIEKYRERIPLLS